MHELAGSTSGPTRPLLTDNSNPRRYLDGTSGRLSMHLLARILHVQNSYANAPILCYSRLNDWHVVDDLSADYLDRTMLLVGLSHDNEQ